MSVNGGNQTVPTVVIVPTEGAEPVVLTNPSAKEVKRVLGVNSAQAG
jgi:mycoredoxin